MAGLTHVKNSPELVLGVLDDVADSLPDISEDLLDLVSGLNVSD